MLIFSWVTDLQSHWEFIGNRRKSTLWNSFLKHKYMHQLREYIRMTLSVWQQLYTQIRCGGQSHSQHSSSVTGGTKDLKLTFRSILVFRMKKKCFFFFFKSFGVRHVLRGLASRETAGKKWWQSGPSLWMCVCQFTSSSWLQHDKDRELYCNVSTALTIQHWHSWVVIRAIINHLLILISILAHT